MNKIILSGRIAKDSYYCMDYNTKYVIGLIEVDREEKIDKKESDQFVFMFIHKDSEEISEKLKERKDLYIEGKLIAKDFYSQKGHK